MEKERAYADFERFEEATEVSKIISNGLRIVEKEVDHLYQKEIKAGVSPNDCELSLLRSIYDDLNKIRGTFAEYVKSCCYDSMNNV